MEYLSSSASRLGGLIMSVTAIQDLYPDDLAHCFGCGRHNRSEEHTSELQSHSFISYAVFCLKKIGVVVGEVALADDPGGDPVVVVVRPEERVVEVDARFEHRNRNSFFNDTATTEIYTLSLHDALPI